MKKLTIVSALLVAGFSSNVAASDLELICTIDGVPGQEVLIRTVPRDEKSDDKKSDFSISTRYKDEVTDTEYKNYFWRSAVGSSLNMVVSKDVRVNRMTGVYTSKSFSGSGFAYVQAATNSNHPSWEISTGVCEPGKHATEAKF